MNGQEIKELINNSVITIESLDTEALAKLMDYETDMLCFGSGDTELICRCSERLDSLRENGITDEKFDSAINKAKATLGDNAASETEEQKSSRRKPRYVLKRIAIIAAAILIMLTSTVAIASAFGVDILDYISRIVRQDKGSEIVVGDFTFDNMGESKKYSSFEEMLEIENLDILYPTKLPEGVYINKVYAFDDTVAEKTISVTTTDANILFSISIQYKKVFLVDRADEVLTVNGIEFYIRDNYAMCYHNGDYYSIKADNYEDLILIIDNMKE